MSKPDKNLISTSRTPINVAADLLEINKRLYSYCRRSSFQHGIIQIHSCDGKTLCAEVWDVAGIHRYLDKLKATYERTFP